MGKFVVLVCALVGCAQSNSVQCGAIVCGQGTVCSPANTCVLQSQLDACTGKADAASCMSVGIDVGVCAKSVCVQAGCGNGVIEPGELCDDGNRSSLDGCSGDCKSNELCGNGVIDPGLGEECDCGMAGAVTPGCMGPNGTAGECRTTCKRSRCGDGTRDPGEVCDDTNTLPGDGCRADCAGRWTALDSGTFLNIAAVHGTSESDVWVVGTAAPHGRIRHWDGTAWAEINPPTSFDVYYGVYAVSPTEVWLLASQVWRGTVLNATTVSWTAMDPPFNTGVGWTTISGRNSEVWVIGTFGSETEIDRYTGSWTHLNDSSVTSSPEDLWVSPSGTGYVTSGSVLHIHNASGWTAAPSEVPAHYVSGTSDSDVFAFVSAPNAYVGGMHFNGTSWSKVPGSSEIGQVTDIAATQGETILVSVQGKVVICTSAGCNISPTGTTAQLNNVWSLSPGQAMIAGSLGTLLY